jgi:signal peptidase I
MQSGRPFLIDRFAYRNTAPRRGDVVVFVRAGNTYMKRVAAVEGDRFQLLKYHPDGDERPLQAWEAEKLRRCAKSSIPLLARVVHRRVPGGCCYVLGDHMQLSEDSRKFGPITLDQIRGKILFAPDHEPELEMAAAPHPGASPARP